MHCAYGTSPYAPSSSSFFLLRSSFPPLSFSPPRQGLPLEVFPRLSLPSNELPNDVVAANLHGLDGSCPGTARAADNDLASTSAAACSACCWIRGELSTLVFGSRRSWPSAIASQWTGPSVQP